MTTRTYYRAALLMPLIVPAIISAAMLLTESEPPLLAWITFYFWASLIIGGGPYLLFAIGFLLWSRRRPDAELRRGVLMAPVTYAAVLMACGLIYVVLYGPEPRRFEGVSALGGFGVVFGYAYVAVAELGRLLLRPRRATVQPVANAV